MTQFWRQGLPITVLHDGQYVPQRIIWRGQTHVVDHIALRWRVDEGWWRWRIWRDYWKLTTRSGLLFVLYHDLLHDEWYLQRLYD